MSLQTPLWPFMVGDFVRAISPSVGRYGVGQVEAVHEDGCLDVVWDCLAVIIIDRGYPASDYIRHERRVRQPWLAEDAT